MAQTPFSVYLTGTNTRALTGITANSVLLEVLGIEPRFQSFGQSRQFASGLAASYYRQKRAFNLKTFPYTLGDGGYETLVKVQLLARFRYVSMYVNEYVDLSAANQLISPGDEFLCAWMNPTNPITHEYANGTKSMELELVETSWAAL